MMFGAWGNPDVGGVPADGRHRARPRRHAVRHRRHVRLRHAPRRSSARRSRGRRDGVVLATKVGNAMSDDLPRSGLSRAVDPPVVRGQPAPAAHRPHRPVPDAPARPVDARSRRRSARCDELVTEGKVRAIGTSTFSAAQLAEAQRARRRAWARRRPTTRAAAVLDPLPRHRARGAAVVRGERRRRASCGRRSTAAG